MNTNFNDPDLPKVLSARHGYNYCPECLVNTVDYEGKCVLCKQHFPKLVQPPRVPEGNLGKPPTKVILLKKVVFVKQPVYEEEVKKFKKIQLRINLKSNYNLINPIKGDPTMSTVKPTVIKTPLSRAAASPTGKTKLEESLAAAEKVRQAKLAKKATKPASAKKEPIKREPTATGTLIQMLLEKKHTDEHILDVVNKGFKKDFNQSFISTCRTRLNTQEKYMMGAVAAAGGRSKVLPIERIEKK